MRLILSLFVLLSTTVYSWEFQSVPKGAADAVRAIEQLPEAKKLIHEVKREGSIRIEFIRSKGMPFEALWDGGARAIRLNPAECKSKASMISSILFELHNAKTNQHLQNLGHQAERRRISPDHYVESVERMEYKNSVDCSQLIQKGIDRGLFPKESEFIVFQSFDDHYKYQRLHGHSQWIANNYPSGRYQGPIEDFDKMSSQDKEDLDHYFSIKFHLESDNPRMVAWGEEMLKKEYEQLMEDQKCLHCGQNHRHQEKSKCLEIVFSNHPLFEKIRTTT